MKFIPAIVVVAFNRPDSLRRLLHSIDVANYPEGVEVPLCICIDHQESQARSKVVEIAREFIWEHGPKEVILQSSNLGLKAHVLLCGDLAERFGSIIMLEDDLYVSPIFYDYSVQALNFYEDEDCIGGVSLYNHKMNFSNQRPFTPIEDGADVYFLQIASSWGQAWSKRQWCCFREWLKDRNAVPTSAKMPDYIIAWPDKSWLKNYIYYLVNTNKVFVFPRKSLTTNFGDVGENSSSINTKFQVPLLVGSRGDFTFVRVANSLAKYDSYFDLEVNVLCRLGAHLNGIDFTNNLSSLKRLEDINTEYVLVQGYHPSCKLEFGLQLKPAELNVVYNIKGSDMVLLSLEEMGGVGKRTKPSFQKSFRYTYGHIDIRAILKYVLSTVKSKMFKE